MSKKISLVRVSAITATFAVLAMAAFSGAIMNGKTSISAVWGELTNQVATNVKPWWPINGVQLAGSQPFKGVLDGNNVETYNMYWSVDGGQWNPMPTSYDGYPHKESQVDVASWTWRGDGPYTVSYIATDATGQEIKRSNVTVSTGTSTLARQTPVQTVALPSQSVSTSTLTAPDATPMPIISPSPANGTNPIKGIKLFVDPASNAKQQADALRASRPADAALIDKIAGQSQAKWFGGWSGNVQQEVSAYTAAAATVNSVPVMVAYNVPDRDCGSYSAGGSDSFQSYLGWIRSFAAGIGANKSIVILEPDALAGMDCLSAATQQARMNTLRDAVGIFKAQPNTAVYIDAGNSGWQTAKLMGQRLANAGIAKADGFSLNVSNFVTNSESETYGQSVAKEVGGKHFVVDSSRNGQGVSPDKEWCNPSGRALGTQPTTATGKTMVDAYLWLKAPGESDGQCNGGPAAGQWWLDYALGLAQRAGW